VLSTRNFLVRDLTVTSQKAQIQALLNGIDEVLSKNTPRLPWVMTNDAAQQRQVLEQTRQYLMSLQQQLDAEPATRGSAAPDSPPSLQSPSESAQQVLQAVLQEMNYWRVNMLQPLRAEIESLQRQREILTQELRQLETQRQQYALPQQNYSQNQQMLMEFLQSAMAQMQANLSGQVTQMIASLSAQAPQLPAQATNSEMATLTPAERLAQMQQMQAQSDQLMLKLDSTLQVIFESLNRNVQSYQESLEQGLSRMHGLGQQGEAMFAFLVNRLAQQLGREASSFLQSSASDWPSAQPSLPGQDSQTDASFTVADFLSQVAEPSSAQSASTFTPAVPFDLSEEVLDIAELDQIGDLPESSALEGLDLELSQLDLGAIPTETEPSEPFDLFMGDQPLPTLDPNRNLTDTDSWQETPTTVSDLDSALDLLNQLSAEMQAGLLDDAPINSPTVELARETELITSPESLYNDDFYNNLLQEPTNPAAEATARIDELTLEQEWFGGMTDPAAQSNTQPPVQPEAQPEFPGGSVSQSVETFLLNDTVPPAATDRFTDFPSSEPEPVETISRLTELVPDPATETPAPVVPAVPEEAAQEEPLPIAEAPAENLNVDLGVDTAEQLGADLTEPSALAQTNAGWDLFADIPAADKPASELKPPALTVEGLEELFENLPDMSAAPSEVGSEAGAEGDWLFQFGDTSNTTESDSPEKKKT
jgi:hypothetical protein